MAKKNITAAFVRIAGETIILVDVRPWIFDDDHEVDIAIDALQLTSGRSVVLVRREPCGCIEFRGRGKHLHVLAAMDPSTFPWQRVEIDFARPNMRKPRSPKALRRLLSPLDDGRSNATSVASPVDARGPASGPIMRDGIGCRPDPVDPRMPRKPPALDPPPGPWHRSAMIAARGLAFVVGGSLMFALAVAGAQPAPKPDQLKPDTKPKPADLAPLVGTAELVKLPATFGFIDDVVYADAQRIAYVLADAANRAELHVYTHATKMEHVVDISAVTLQPIAIALVAQRAFVVGQTEDGAHTAALIELTQKAKNKPAGTVVYKLGPTNEIAVITRDGKQRAVTHKVTSVANGGVRHDVELIALETGKRIGAARAVELDSTGASDKLGFRINHWTDGWTRAHGIKAGEWDRKENQRAPDVEASYDVLTGKFGDRKKIEDLFEQRRRFQALAGAAGKADFVRTSWDNTSIHIWRAGKLRVVDLDQPITSYDPTSLQGVVQADGSAWMVLKVDPVNAEAVARKKADPEYLDVFAVTATAKTAVRKARILAEGVRHRFGVVGDKFWLVERNTGFERGGKSIAWYSLQ